MKKISVALIIMIFTISSIQAQKEKDKKDRKEELIVKLREGAKPIIYVDGKIFDFPMELIDQSKIESVFVVKGADAKTKYKAPDGVILITTKSFELIKISEESITKNYKIESKNDPIVIVDGKVVDKNILEELKTETIDKMQVIKGEEALKKYNAPNGVIIITTKKR
ncbi:hypothetical protein [Polaribacter sp. Hel_I_88]|uniref:hypothetical protein n=1 Tax=Polaribacter sp. Hel_I_88 TaxID=1250006 RepID=UPI0004795524|nr:hypothetical protein [Polaribacter sp. Hel_I_88]